ncbi:MULTISPECIES: glycosyltransferase family 2 protein [Flavobacteriaceae]|uniref:Glycosyltransferase family 2 protein n=2 Tax=Flavobacteriaceae TaxID=49546 RepID=A0A4Y8AX13_9FLAO|nr:MULTISPECIES: glycosyltransferase family 2 protein [Flavobacteriaceae]TEW76572.1 glycosyltransferase family 2 protein [Gramella jeungdoensis]GGK54098.1 glycosyl transferase [Lutibacter litoralis]
MFKNSHIIIATYNAMSWLPKCLKSCETYNIIVVDNNSTDATVQFIQENYPSIILIQQKENLGFGAANNIGISYALKNGADYVFLLNQDAYLETNTIEKLINIHKENKEYGIISPIHLNGSGKSLDKNFSNYIKANNTLLFDALQYNFTKLIYEVPFVNAAGWLLPKETLVKVGGFDPIFFHYGEDDNYCQRVLYHGYKIGVVPKMYMLHDREFRKNNNLISVKDKLMRKELSLKGKWADINFDINNELNNQQKKKLRLILKLVIKFQFNKATFYFKEFQLIKRIVPEILKSRTINKTKGNHYLNF